MGEYELTDIEIKTIDDWIKLNVLPQKNSEEKLR
jgi:hypothetical protein